MSDVSPFRPFNKNTLCEIVVWDPQTVGLWSIFLTPSFGSILILLNWKTLRCDSSYKRSVLWMGGMIGFEIVYQVMQIFMSDMSDNWNDWLIRRLFWPEWDNHEVQLQREYLLPLDTGECGPVKVKHKDFALPVTIAIIVNIALRYMIVSVRKHFFL